MKKVLSCLVLTLLGLLLPFPAAADMGPKPEITIVVKNAPQGEYYLDLLIPEKNSYDNLRENREHYDSDKLSLLESMESSGWYPALVRGTNVPLFGDLVGEAQGNTMVHTFRYYGVPTVFRIAVATPDRRLVVTDPIRKKMFEETITYDFSTGKMIRESIGKEYLTQFGFTCGATLLSEGLLLLLFGYSFRKNWKPFLLVNIFTQILLTATAGSALLFSGLLAAYVCLIAMELVIAGTEACLYRKFLVGRSKARAVVYALAANAASCAAGFFLIGQGR